MQEEDPTAIEPDEQDLPPKPRITEMPPEDGLNPPAEDRYEEDVPDDVFLPRALAADDPTIDDQEAPE